jgi:hypothetical protein
LKKSEFKSRLAIFIASTPRLAPRVPAPISDFTSIIFNSFTGYQCLNKTAGQKKENSRIPQNPQRSGKAFVPMNFGTKNK